MVERSIEEMREDMAFRGDELLGEWDRLCRAWAPLLVKPPRHLWWVGCGDPFFAASALQWALRQAGWRTTAHEALEFRYAVEAVEPGDIVVGISYSGAVARTREALRNARRRGAVTVAVTGHAAAPIVAEADHVIPLGLPARGLAPGTKTYLNMLLAVAAVAQARGEAVPIPHIVPVLVESLTGWITQAMAWAERVPRQGPVHVLGAGPNAASAQFGAAKLWEGAQLDAYAQYLEEWAHGQYFVCQPGQALVVVCPQGRALGRAVEIAREAVYVGASVTCLTDVGEPFAAVGAAVIAVPPVPEAWSPLVVTGPLALMGYAVAKARGKSSYNFRSAEAEREHYDTLHNSVLWPGPEEETGR